MSVHDDTQAALEELYAAPAAAGRPRTPADHLRAASLAAFNEGTPAGGALGWWLRDTATIHVPDSSGRSCERDGDDWPCLDVRAALKYAELITASLEITP